MGALSGGNRGRSGISGRLQESKAGEAWEAGGNPCCRAGSRLQQLPQPKGRIKTEPAQTQGKQLSRAPRSPPSYRAPKEHNIKSMPKEGIGCISIDPKAHTRSPKEEQVERNARIAISPKAAISQTCRTEREHIALSGTLFCPDGYPPMCAIANRTQIAEWHRQDPSANTRIPLEMPEPAASQQTCSTKRGKRAMQTLGDTEYLGGCRKARTGARRHQAESWEAGGNP